MAETIRDVVVKARLEFQTPDLSKVNQALSATKRHVKDIQDASDKTAAAQVEGSKKAAEAAGGVNDAVKQIIISEKIAAHERKKAAAEAVAAAEKKKAAAQKVANAIKRQEKAHLAARKAAEEAAKKVVESSFQAAEAAKRAGEGAFVLARGITFVTASNEENFAKAVRSIAKVQGAFEIFKGSTDTIIGTTQAIKSLAANSKIAAVAGKAMRLAFSPAGLIIGGLVAGISALALAFSDMKDKSKDATKSILDDLESQREKQQKLIDNRKILLGLTSAKAAAQSQFRQRIAGRLGLGQREAFLEGELSGLGRLGALPSTAITGDPAVAAQIGELQGGIASREEESRKLQGQPLLKLSDKQRLIALQQQNKRARKQIADLEKSERERQAGLAGGQLPELLRFRDQAQERIGLQQQIEQAALERIGGRLDVLQQNRDELISRQQAVRNAPADLVARQRLQSLQQQLGPDRDTTAELDQAIAVLVNERQAVTSKTTRLINQLAEAEREANNAIADLEAKVQNLQNAGSRDPTR